MLASDFINGAIAFLLTILIFSYLIGDNPLFRIAIYLFIGVSAGYIAAITWHQVLWPRLFQPFFGGDWATLFLAVIPLLLGALMLGKLSPRLAHLGNLPMAFLVGIGAAVAIGGAVTGTLLPQTINTLDLLSTWRATPNPWERIGEGLIILGGMVTTLTFFHYGVKASPLGPRRNRLITILAWIGQIFLAITLGVLFAGVFAAAMTALVERWIFILSFLRRIL